MEKLRMSTNYDIEELEGATRGLLGRGSSGSHAPAWEQVQTLQRRVGPRATGAAGRHSHAGAWERDRWKR